MEDLLKELVGKKIDVNCGNAAIYRGEAIDVNNGVLHLRNEDDVIVFISIAKISAMFECKDLPSRPGFIV
ncbi:MAG: MM0924 family protein [Pyrinomonadaceae bacterium]